MGLSADIIQSKKFLEILTATLVYRILFFSLLLTPSWALSHSAERGLVMLLPTQYYAWGAALSVAASFILLAFIPAKWIKRQYTKSWHLYSIRTWHTTTTSCLSFAVVLTLVYIGFTGSSDPLKNILPLTVWAGWWIAFTLLQFFVGNLWNYLNPWSGPITIIRRFLHLDESFFVLPEKINYLPALLLFSIFAWFELVDVAPQDPMRLATAVTVYWLVNFIAILLYGEKKWFRYAEPFSVFFRLIGQCAIIKKQAEVKQNKTYTKLSLCWPGSNLINDDTLPWLGILFVILTLSTVSFDGLAKTFFWLSLFDINPLLFPGRSSVIAINTLGILLSFAALALLFFICNWTGIQLLPRKNHLTNSYQVYGRLIYCLIPISLGFHFSHFLTTLLIDGQYLLHALRTLLPIQWQSELNHHVTTSFLNNIDSVSIIWKTQTIIIVIVHIVSIIVAHSISLNLFHGTNTKLIVLSQIFMAAFMVFYTTFGLWLLSTASIG